VTRIYVVARGEDLNLRPLGYEPISDVFNRRPLMWITSIVAGQTLSRCPQSSISFHRDPAEFAYGLLTACLRPILFQDGAVGVFPIRVPIPSRAEICILKPQDMELHGRAARYAKAHRASVAQVFRSFGTANMIVCPRVGSYLQLMSRTKLCCDGRTVDQGQYRCDPPVAEAIEDVLREDKSFADG
jgi:hypothetical protein